MLLGGEQPRLSRPVAPAAHRCDAPLLALHMRRRGAAPHAGAVSAGRLFIARFRTADPTARVGRAVTDRSGSSAPTPSPTTNRKYPSSNHAWLASPTPPATQAASHGSASGSRPDCPHDQRPQKHRRPPASPVAGLAAQWIPGSFRLQQGPQISLRFALERPFANCPQALVRTIDELLVAAPLSQTSPRLRNRLRSIGPRRAAARAQQPAQWRSSDDRAADQKAPSLVTLANAYET